MKQEISMYPSYWTIKLIIFLKKLRHLGVANTGSAFY